VHAILEDIAGELAMAIKYVHSPGQFNRDLASYLEQNSIDFLTYANADINFVRQLEHFRGFHVIRDPRDIAVSSYFSHLHSHPTDGWASLEAHRETLQEISKEEGLFRDMEFIHNDVFERMARWDYSLPHVLEVKMEDLTREPVEQFMKIAEFLGILKKRPTIFSRQAVPRISAGKLEKIIHKKNFSRLSGGRKPGEENSKHHFRKGVAGDWVNHFNEDHKNYFKEKYNPLLVQLGYENDDRW
jgi:hypothetical protein